MTTPKSSESKGPVKEKLRSIMDAASALTSLGDESENENNSRPSSPAKDGSKAEEPKETTVETPDADKEVKEEAKSDLESGEKRYLPDHKKADAALTFPEKVCSLSAWRVLNWDVKGAMVIACVCFVCAGERSCGKDQSGVSGRPCPWPRR